MIYQWQIIVPFNQIIHVILHFTRLFKHSSVKLTHNEPFFKLKMETTMTTIRFVALATLDLTVLISEIIVNAEIP